MPRRRRTDLDDVPLHVVQRGHDREPCFCTEEDCCAYLRISLAGWHQAASAIFCLRPATSITKLP